MSMLKNILLALLFILIGAASSYIVLNHKDQPSDMALTQAKVLINTISNNQAEIHSHFNAIGNVEGFIVSPKDKPGQESIVYVDLKSNFAILGAIFDSNGSSINKRDFDKYIQTKTAEQAYKTIANTHYIEQGKADAPAKAYIVLDPNCIFCHRLFNQMQADINEGKIAVRWIVIGLMKPSSKNKAANILSSATPLEALKQNEKNFNEKIEEGGSTDTPPPAASLAKIESNNTFFTEAGLNQTPATFYQTSNQIKKVLMGFPPNLNALYKTMSSQF